MKLPETFISLFQLCLLWVQNLIGRVKRSTHIIDWCTNFWRDESRKFLINLPAILSCFVNYYIFFLDFSNATNEINRLKIVILGIGTIPHDIHPRIRWKVVHTFTLLAIVPQEMRPQYLRNISWMLQRKKNYCPRQDSNSSLLYWLTKAENSMRMFRVEGNRD